MEVFRKGDEVEVRSKEEGFLGSYYEATVISQLNGNTRYKVQYKNLVEEEDQTRPLVEIVSADEVRPMPPRTVGEATRIFYYLDKVDAFDNDGWWVGNISGKQGSKYWVYFDTTQDEIAYPVSQLRNHLEWSNGKWVSSK
ncbi:DUF724 domain-containing protein 6 [Durio zibethinus]|uniref:DUF724 domain-containing protein 6 n=1 Tax=Durio zibethinus TaxID=66656 RepID=A0A6P5YTU5_DURZI|nr:DUF724 domain-containing protein 6 [Durio zibethinus]